MVNRFDINRHARKVLQDTEVKEALDRNLMHKDYFMQQSSLA